MLAREEPEGAIVEVGSSFGRSTIALATVVSGMRTEARLIPVDANRGKVSALGVGLQVVGPFLGYLTTGRLAEPAHEVLGVPDTPPGFGGA